MSDEAVFEELRTQYGFEAQWRHWSRSFHYARNVNAYDREMDRLRRLLISERAKASMGIGEAE